MTVETQPAPGQARAQWTMDRGWKPMALLSTWRRRALLGLAVFAVVFGILVEEKGALIHSRHTDVGTYFSAAWAIRIGSDPYSVTDRNGWHYTYPPLLAVLLGPLADASYGMRRVGAAPYPLSVGIWYLLSIGFLFYGTNRLARTLVGVLTRQRCRSSDGSTPDPCENNAPPARWAWRWWSLLFWPLLLCAPAICRSVVRGQVGPLWLMLICLMICDVLERRPGRAGLWLAGAICLKLIPAFLLLYPLWRRERKMLITCALGMIAGFVLIPLTAMGPSSFASANAHYFNSFIRPTLTGGRIDKAVERELVDPVQSDTNSFVAILMNTGYLLRHTPRLYGDRSYTPPRFAKVGHWLLGGTMTLLTLGAAGARRHWRDPLNEVLFLSLLTVVMLPIAPVCHPHYYMLMVPLIAGLLATYLGPCGLPYVTAGWIILLALIPAAHLITVIPGFEVLRDLGLVTWVAVAAWAAATYRLWERRTSTLVVYVPEEMAGSDGN